MAQLRSSGHSWDASQCASASSGMEVAARQASAGAGSDHANLVVVWLTAADLAEVGRMVDCCCSEGNVLFLRLCMLPRFTPFSLHYRTPSSADKWLAIKWPLLDYLQSSACALI